MDTLGSLCDKLTIIKLKQWHHTGSDGYSGLLIQESELIYEINSFVASAINGDVPKSMLKFSSYKIGGESECIPAEDIGSVFAQLANVNCDIWHDVDKSMHIDDYPEEDVIKLVKRLAKLNLDRNRFKEEIDNIFHRLCS